MELGILSRERLVRSLGPSFTGDWFELNVNLRPKDTLNLFKTTDLIRLGFLPLGTKKGDSWFGGGTRLNIGMINPEAKEQLSEILALVPPEYKNTKTYLIPADRFIDALVTIYGVDRSSLRKLGSHQINPMLSLFLEA